MMRSFFETLVMTGVLMLVLAVSVWTSVPLQAAPITLPFGGTKGGQDLIQHLPDIGPTDEQAAAFRASEAAKQEAAEARGETYVPVSTGVLAFRNLLSVVGAFLTPLLRAVAVMALFIAGYQLVSAQSAASEEMSKQKMNIVYILIGLVVFGLSAETVYNYIFVDEGDSLLLGAGEDLQTAADRLYTTRAIPIINRILDLLDLFLQFSGAAAILALVVASIRLVLNPGDDEQIAKQKKLVGYTAVAIVIIGLAETAINRIFFARGGEAGVQVDALEEQLLGLSNYVLGFMGAIVLVTFMVSGVLMVINFGNEDMTNKIKATLRNVVIGFFVAFSAYTIVATILRTFLAAEPGV